MDRFVLLSGCSGGGESSLLTALGEQGYAIIEEPGRRIIAAGGPKPWSDSAGFANRAVELALADRKSAPEGNDWVFFDRGLVDALVARREAEGIALSPMIDRHRYNATVFLTPPWPENFVHDDARLHGFEEAVSEYDRLVEAYVTNGYAPVFLPKVPVDARVEFILERLVRNEASGGFWAEDQMLKSSTE